VTIRSAEIHSVRYDQGIQIKYAVKDDDHLTETDVVKGLKPQFSHHRIITISKIKEEHLEFFENGFITFLVYGKQVDIEPDKRLMKMTTRVCVDLYNLLCN
jgi:kinesin family protein 1